MKNLFRSFIFAFIFISTVFAQDVNIPGDTVTIETENGLKSVYVGNMSGETEPESLSQSIYGNLRDSLKKPYSDDWRNGPKVLDDTDSTVYGAINLYTSITNLNRLWTALGLYTKSEEKSKPQAGSLEATTGETPEPPPFSNFVQPVAQYVGYTFPANEKRVINTGSDGNYGHLTFIGTGKITDENTPAATQHAPYNSTASRCFDFRTVPDVTGNGANAAMSMSPYYNPVGKAQKFTIMAWIYRGRLDGGENRDTPEPDNTASRIVADSPGSNGESGFDVRFSGSEGKLQLRINGEILTASGNTGGINTGISPGSRSWYFIALWFDGTKDGGTSGTGGTTGKRVSCYVGSKNGNSFSLTEKSSGANKGGQIADEVPLNNISLYIGNSGGANTYVGNFNGYIDDVMIFKDWTPDDCGDDKLKAISYWATNDDVNIIVPNIYESEPLGLIHPDKEFYTADQIETRLQDFSIDRYLRIDHIDGNNVNYIADDVKFEGNTAVTDLYVTNLNAENVVITNLNARNTSITNLDVQTASITNLTTKDITTTNLTAKNNLYATNSYLHNASVTNLNATSGSITNLNANNGVITNLTVQQISDDDGSFITSFNQLIRYDYDSDDPSAPTAITSGERGEGFNIGPHSINIGTNNSIYLSPAEGIGLFQVGDILAIYPADGIVSNKTGTITAQYNDATNNIAKLSFSPGVGHDYHVGDILVVENQNRTIIKDGKTINVAIDGMITEIDPNNNSLKEFIIGIRSTAAAGKYSIAIGQSVLAMADFSIALGQYSSAYGVGSVAIGGDCFAYGECSSAKGNHSSAFGKYSVVEGDNCSASGESSYASGGYSHALGNYSRATGDHTIASNQYSQASGQYVKATNDYAFVWNGAGLTPRGDHATPKSTSPDSFEDLDEYYGSHGDGSFNILPDGEVNGFYIGERSLGDYIDARIQAAFAAANENYNNTGNWTPGDSPDIRTRVNDPSTW